MVGEDEVVGTEGERLTKVGRSPWRQPPVDGKTWRRTDLIAEWPERWPER